MRSLENFKQSEKRRKKAIELLGTNLQPVEVARILGVDSRSVRRWKTAYIQNGMEGLMARVRVK